MIYDKRQLYENLARLGIDRLEPGEYKVESEDLGDIRLDVHPADMDAWCLVRICVYTGEPGRRIKAESYRIRLRWQTQEAICLASDCTTLKDGKPTRSLRVWKQPSGFTYWALQALATVCTDRLIETKARFMGVGR